MIDSSEFSPIAVIAGPILRMRRDLSVSRAWLGV
jgi:hypothetical protein